MAVIEETPMSYRGNPIRIHKLTRREPGEANVGCDHDAVQVCYKADTTRPEYPNLNGEYLAALLTKQGFTVAAGEEVAGTPLMYLCVGKAVGTATRDEVVAVLKRDANIDLTNIDRIEGTRGSDQ
jgi:hypothetical protein